MIERSFAEARGHLKAFGRRTFGCALAFGASSRFTFNSGTAGIKHFKALAETGQFEWQLYRDWRGFLYT